MSENKFLAKMRGEKAPKSLVEVKNYKFSTPFVGLPKSTSVSDGFDNEAGHSVIVAKSAQNWALQNSGIEPLADAESAKYTGQITNIGHGMWVNSSYTFPLSEEPSNPVVAIINPCAKWVLNFVGKDLFSQNDTIGFTLVVKIGATHISNIDCEVKRQAGFFCQKFVIDFSESEQELIKVNGGDTLTVQLVCNDDTASAVYYTGSSVLSLLQRKVDGEVVAGDTKTFNEVVEDISDIRKDIDERFFGVYKFKGTVPTVADLPATGNTIGDTYNIAETGSNYAWDGQNWDKLSETLDLTPYQKVENLSQELDNDTTKYPSNKAVKEAVDKKDSYPEQIGHEGEFLQTNGDKTSWAKPLPVQKDNAGKFLKTNGKDAEWANVRELPEPDGNTAKILMNDGQRAYWDYIPSAVPLLFTVWSDHVINDVSWLRADTFSWQSGDVYKSVYDHLVDDWNNATSVDETVNGHTFSVMVAKDGHKLFSMNGHDLAQTLYDETGVAWYYILDQENKRFKLPRTKFGFTGLRDSVGEYVPAGVPNITGSAGYLKALKTGNYYQAINFSSGAFKSSTSNTSGLSTKPTAVEPGTQETTNAGGILNFSASDSSPVYGNSNTVQPKATQMYLYFYVGNYTKDQYTVDIGKVSELINDFDFETSRKAINDVRDAAITAVNTEREDSLQDIETARDNSVSQLESMGNALNHTNISNCVTKIPQDIKLELADGRLTVKAGSKFYVPNGAGKFDILVTEKDMSSTYSNASGTQNMLLVISDGSSYDTLSPSSVSSGSTDSLAGTPYHAWYDTTNNLVKLYLEDGVTVARYLSFPFAITHGHNNGGSDIGVDGIDQVFNGFGYIGSTMFVLPGVKVLAPYGRNEDGSLKNYPWTASKVIVRTGTYASEQDIAINCTNGSFGVGTYSYDSNENFNYASGAVSDRRCVIGKIVSSGNNISSFVVKPVFHAVDYSDFISKANKDLSNLPSNYDYVIKTYVSGNTWYRKYKSGWVEQGSVASITTSGTTITLPVAMKNTSYSVYATGKRDSNLDGLGLLVATRSTTSVVIRNKNYGSSNTFSAFWEVKGYAA